MRSKRSFIGKFKNHSKRTGKGSKKHIFNFMYWNMPECGHHCQNSSLDLGSLLNTSFLNKNLTFFLSLSEMGLQAVSRSQSSSTLTGHQCWSAVLGWLQCALTAVEAASRGLTYSIRCSAGWECSRRKTSWMSSGSCAAICAQHAVNIHQCQHTAAQTCCISLTAWQIYRHLHLYHNLT